MALKGSRSLISSSHVQALLWHVGEQVGVQTSEILSSGADLKSCLHDIKSPLSVVSLLKPQIEEMNGEVAQLLIAALTQIESISKRLNSDDARNKERLIGCSSDEFVNAVLNLCKSKELEFNEMGKVVVSLESKDEERLIEGHKGEWLSILSNLINNSIESSHGAFAIDVSIYPRGKFLELWVTDDGSGMAPLQIKGFNSGKFSSTKGSGRGLGLAKAYEYTKKFSGSIRFENQAQGGLRVILKIPYQ